MREVLSSPLQPHFLEIIWQRHVSVKWLGLLLRIRESQLQISARRLPELINDIVRNFPQLTTSSHRFVSNPFEIILRYLVDLLSLPRQTSGQYLD
jgi:hypothetical protein